MSIKHVNMGTIFYLPLPNWQRPYSLRYLTMALRAQGIEILGILKQYLLTTSVLPTVFFPLHQYDYFIIAIKQASHSHTLRQIERERKTNFEDLSIVVCRWPRPIPRPQKQPNNQLTISIIKSCVSSCFSPKYKPSHHHHTLVKTIILELRPWFICWKISPRKRDLLQTHNFYLKANHLTFM